MNRANEDIRTAAKKANIPLWKIADRYGMNDGNFTRIMRKELSKEKKEHIFAIIKEITTEERG